MKELREYLLLKKYNTTFGDIVPLVIANAHKINISIINQTLSWTYPVFIKPSHPSTTNLTVHLHGEHYSGGRLLPCHHSNQPMRKQTNNYIKYSANELHSLQSPTYNITHKVRKKLFALQIWRPQLNSNKTIHRIATEVPLTSWNFPSIINTNLTGALNCKLTEICTICKDFNCDLFCCTETWCTPLVPNEAIQLTSDGLYTLFRRDRKDGRQHGGLACYARSNIPVVNTWSELDTPDLEVMWITFQPQRLPRKISSITLGVIYHPPGSDNWKMSSHLVTCVDKIRKHYPQTALIIVGDFNHMPDQYLKSACNLTQVVNKTTLDRSIIDLIYTNIPEYYLETHHEPGIGLSKHQVIIWKPQNCQTPQNRSKSLTVMKRKQGPKEKAALIRAVDKINWRLLYSLPTCQEQLQAFYSVLNKTIDELTPLTMGYFRIQRINQKETISFPPGQHNTLQIFQEYGQQETKDPEKALL